MRERARTHRWIPGHGPISEMAGHTLNGVEACNRGQTATRAAFQVLVLPYRKGGAGGIVYALFRRKDAAYWQGVAGGGEQGESPLQAARREAAEEAGLAEDAELTPLDSMVTIPVVDVTGDFRWGPDVLVVPEHAFGVRCDQAEIRLSPEHTEYGWFSFDEAVRLIRWDSNRNALWELNHRLRHDRLRRTG
jgi:dihydroneopterin triphosphate diphosphatase